MTATAADDLRSGTLGVNVFTAPGKSVIGERPRPYQARPAGLRSADGNRYIPYRELFDEMTRLYPDWVSNQSWLMFGLPLPTSLED
jgi:hypothetical protein